MEGQSGKRVRIVARILLVWAILIMARLLQLQVLRHEEFQQLADQQQEKLIEIKAPRGGILDRAGEPLAMSLPVDSVCVNPLRLPDLRTASDLLAGLLNLDSTELFGKMKLAADNGRGFMWVKRRITPDESKRLHSLDPMPEWIEFRTESRRFYPHDSLAAHVVGSVDFDEHGNAGVEQALNDDLEGHAGEERMLTDVKQRGIDSQIDTAAHPGSAVRLTIDSQIQFVAERELKAAIEKHHCKSGSVVAMDPNTGEILALANFPTFDPNTPPKPGEDLSGRENLAVTAPFEPGSVFKVVTVSTALETTNLRPETMISCGNGRITLFGRTIHESHGGGFSALPMEDVLARSSNIGAINIGLKIGEKKMYEYVRRFGFGSSIGLPLPGESGGLVRSLKAWQATSLASVAMGHEIMVTPLQLAQLCSLVANGGMLVKPKLTLDEQTPAPKRVLRPETAITMRQMMEGVVIKPYGTGHKYCRIPGYSSAGKTGTAQIYDFKTHQYTHFYNASFMGFAPVENPRIVVVVSVHGATGLAGYGGPSAGPVFREVAAAALRMRNVPKDLPDALPDTGKDDSDPNDLAIAELGSSNPLPLVPAEPNNSEAFSAVDQRAFLTPVAAVGPQPIGTKTPDFQGKSVREVLEASSALGITVETTGQGIARSQTPVPGAVLPAGERVRVQFGR